MSKFDHPNVLTLRGVCLDGGPAPFIIMPFMVNGSLLAYLKKSRSGLIVSNENENDEVKYKHMHNTIYSIVAIYIPSLKINVNTFIISSWTRGIYKQ